MKPSTASIIKPNPYSDTASLRKIASNSNNQDVLWFLSQNKNPLVRRGVASNIHANPELLDTLSTDDSEDVRFDVALNPSSSPETLERLYSTERDAVSVAIASNVNISESLATRIASSSNSYLRIRLSQNMCLINYPNVVHILAQDANSIVLTSLNESPAKIFFNMV